jgi:hypothetical protein
MFHILTAASMKMTIFRDTAPCRLVDLIMEAVRTSETSVSFYKTTRHNAPEDYHAYTESLPNDVMASFYSLWAENAPNVCRESARKFL